MRVGEIEKKNGGKFIENDAFDNFVQTIIKIQQAEPSSFASLMPHMWYDFLRLKELDAIIALFFFTTLLDIIPTNSTLRALPEGLFEEFRIIIRGFESRIGEHRKMEEVVKKLENGFEFLH